MANHLLKQNDYWNIKRVGLVPNPLQQARVTNTYSAIWALPPLGNNVPQRRGTPSGCQSILYPHFFQWLVDFGSSRWLAHFPGFYCSLAGSSSGQITLSRLRVIGQLCPLIMAQSDVLIQSLLWRKKDLFFPLSLVSAISHSLSPLTVYRLWTHTYWGVIFQRCM